MHMRIGIGIAITHPAPCRTAACTSIAELRHGPVRCEAAIEPAVGWSLTAVVTAESAKHPGLHPDAQVCALFQGLLTRV